MGRHLAIPGTPIPQGSMRAYAVAGKAFVTTASPGPLAQYRNDIRHAFGTPAPLDGPMRMSVEFAFARPTSHYNATGDLKGRKYKRPAPTFVTNKPDVDKLARAVLDALSGYAYHDDKQVVRLTVMKTYEPEATTYISVAPVEEGPASQWGPTPSQERTK